MGATQYCSANQSRRVEWLCLGTNRGCEGVDSHIQFLLVRAANSSVVGNPEARNSARNAARSPTSSDSSTPVCKLESKLLRMIVGRRRELEAKLRACCRRGGHAPSLRSRPAARRTIPALLEGRAARRSRAVVALQPKCQQDDCPALPLYAGVDAGIAAGCHCAVDSSRRALSATAQPLGRPVAQRRQSFWIVLP